MAVIIKQKDNSKPDWWVFIHINGRRITKKIGTKEQAEAVAREIRRRLKQNDSASFSFDTAATPNGNGHAPVEHEHELPTLREFTDRYMDEYAKIVCKLNTWKGYESSLRLHILPSLGYKRLDEITRADIKALLLSKQQTLAPGTVHNIRVLISGIFTYAYEDQIITANPALRLGKIIQKADRRANIRPLTREQATAFLQAATEHEPSHYAFLLCAFRTGMRMGELAGLAWDDIDFVGNRIEVRRSFSHGHFTTPKSHKSRPVDMSDQLAQTLRDHRTELLNQAEGRLRPVTFNGAILNMVFPGYRGKPLDSDNFRARVFRPLIELAGIPRFRFHDIRHTFASMLLGNGESLHYVKEQMGHASIQTTVDVYGHLVPGSNRQAVNRLDDPDAPTLRLVGSAG